MHPLIDIDASMEQWEEHLKNAPVPTPCSLDDAIRYTNLKNTISHLGHKIRVARFENDTEAEEWYIEHFAELYTEFEKDFVYRILKNG